MPAFDNSSTGIDERGGKRPAGSGRSLAYRGIGTILVNRVPARMDTCRVAQKRVSVSAGHGDVRQFYRASGYYPRVTVPEQT